MTIYFYPSVTLAKPDNMKDFKECLDAEKQAWQKDHSEPEPIN